jgi:hypothetical protein
MSAIPVRGLWLDPNSCQRSKTHLDLLTVASDRHRSGELNVHRDLNVGAQRSLSFERVGIGVLHPDILSAGIGPVGSVHPHGPITAHGMSAVCVCPSTACRQSCYRATWTGEQPLDHILIDLPAAGHEINSCRAGSISIEKSAHGLTCHPGRKEHDQFIHDLESPLCRAPAAIREWLHECPRQSS